MSGQTVGITHVGTTVQESGPENSLFPHKLRERPAKNPSVHG